MVCTVLAPRTGKRSNRPGALRYALGHSNARRLRVRGNIILSGSLMKLLTYIRYLFRSIDAAFFTREIVYSITNIHSVFDKTNGFNPTPCGANSAPPPVVLIIVPKRFDRGI